MKKDKLPLTEELDFVYLLTLMPALHNVPQFAWLPELFSIIGHDGLIRLSKYCGGEKIRIPTLEELSESIEALQWFYDVEIKHIHQIAEVPVRVIPLVLRIKEIFEDREDAKSG